MDDLPVNKRTTVFRHHVVYETKTVAWETVVIPFPPIGREGLSQLSFEFFD
jgi:hypothetical protein